MALKRWGPRPCCRVIADTLEPFHSAPHSTAFFPDATPDCQRQDEQEPPTREFCHAQLDGVILVALRRLKATGISDVSEPMQSISSFSKTRRDLSLSL